MLSVTIVLLIVLVGRGSSVRACMTGSWPKLSPNFVQVVVNELHVIYTERWTSLLEVGPTGRLI